MTLASMNFLTRSAFCRAVKEGAPIVLFNTEHQVPAINGPHRVVGPWPRTAAPVEDIPVCGAGRFSALARRDEQGRLIKARERVLSWHVDVRVEDMRVVEVLA
jgi:hypothetical protein